ASLLLDDLGLGFRAAIQGIFLRQVGLNQSISSKSTSTYSPPSLPLIPWISLTMSEPLFCASKTNRS
ncbi:hypothetical protein L917_17994, partial [Phytophthora nicotianae]